MTDPVQDASAALGAGAKTLVSDATTLAGRTGAAALNAGQKWWWAIALGCLAVGFLGGLAA